MQRLEQPPDFTCSDKRLLAPVENQKRRVVLHRGGLRTIALYAFSIPYTMVTRWFDYTNERLLRYHSFL